MKDYYLFPNEGSAVKIEKDGTQYKLSLETTYARFTKENLVEQLNKFIKYLEKYQNDESN